MRIKLYQIDKDRDTSGICFMSHDYAEKHGCCAQWFPVHSILLAWLSQTAVRSGCCCGFLLSPQRSKGPDGYGIHPGHFQAAALRRKQPLLCCCRRRSAPTARSTDLFLLIDMLPMPQPTCQNRHERCWFVSKKVQ